MYSTDFKEVKLFKKGKVRDVYEFDGKLLLVATDRISCFDVVLPTPIPDKGRILTQLSLFWFSRLEGIVENHFISSDPGDLPVSLSGEKDSLAGRFVIAKKCEVIPFECVVRGYLSGSGWKEYRQSGRVCGVNLPSGLVQSQKLSEPIFTPAIKAESGHDQNVDFNYLKDKLGGELAVYLKETSIALYEKAAAFSEERGVIIADTKFEFGMLDGKAVLVDEVLTPDSSRFWPREKYNPGKPQESFDKQFVRDYLEGLGWDKTAPAPALPGEIVGKTREKYREAFKIITGRDFQ